MWKLFMKWLKSLVGSKTSPTPVVDPVVVAPPQPKPEPLVPTPLAWMPPEPKECLPNTLHIFCEASGPLTFFGAATGRPANEIYYHAIYGVAPASGRTFRLIHPFYAPCKDPFDLAPYVSRAKAEGCVGISVDPEAWIPQQGPQWFRTLSAECRKCGLLLAVVPKIKLEHLVTWWKMSSEDAGKVISETCDIDLEWQYLTTGDQYADSFESDTVSIQQLGLVDGTGDRWKPA
jgi:hypothetical protein